MRPPHDQDEPRAGVSVIVPHYDDVQNLIRCARALGAQTMPPWEVVVVDNGSPCGLPAIRAALDGLCPNLTVIEARERGAGPARNAGVLATSGALLAFLDGDVRPRPDWIERGRNFLARGPIVGGRVDVEAADPARATAIEAWDMMFGFNAGRVFRRGRHLLTGNLWVRRDVFETVGAFRNGVPEDMDWCLRATAAGYPLSYEPDLVVVHPALAAWDRLAARWRRLTAEQARWAAGRRFGRLVFWARSFAVLASILPHAARIVRSQRVPGANKGQILAILVRVRVLRFAEAQRWMLAAGGRQT